MSRPTLTIDPAICRGVPHVTGSGARAWVVADRVCTGEPVDDVAEDYDITRNEALLCVVWCGPSPAFTSPDFRARWHRWADNAWHALTHGETVPDPPVEGR